MSPDALNSSQRNLKGSYSDCCSVCQGMFNTFLPTLKIFTNSSDGTHMQWLAPDAPQYCLQGLNHCTTGTPVIVCSLWRCRTQRHTEMETRSLDQTEAWCWVIPYNTEIVHYLWIVWRSHMVMEVFYSRVEPSRRVHDKQTTDWCSSWTRQFSNWDSMDAC